MAKQSWVFGVMPMLIGLGFAVPVMAESPVPVVVTVVSNDPEVGRFVLLEGGRNFRDAGGYLTADGRTVKRGLLYRSGSLGTLSVNGQQQLAGLHVSSIVDLRTTDERHGDNNNWLAMSGQGYWARDYGYSLGEMSAIFAKPENRTAAAVQAIMAQAYRRIAQEQAPAYRVLFARLISGKGTVVVNCTAGKDRTGIATALVLTALGVPYETVRLDFLLSNNAPGMANLQSSLSGPLSSLPAEVIKPLTGVEGAYLDSAFDQLRQDYGSIENFMDKELGVGPREIAVLRRRMLI